MKKHILLLVLALAGGCAGFLLRSLQLTAAYDPYTRLFQADSPFTLGLFGLVGLLAALYFFLLRDCTLPEDDLPAYRCPSSLYLTGMAASAFLLFGAGLLGLLDNMGGLGRLAPGQVQVTSVAASCLCATLCIPAGLAVLLLGKTGYRGELTPSSSMVASFPPFCALVWMFSIYLENGSNPIFLEYGLLLTASALLMLSHYYAAAYFFGSHKPRRALFCSLLGISLGLAALADRPDRFTALILLGLLLGALAQSCALARSCFGPAWPEHLLNPPPKEDEDDDEDDF